MLITNVLDVKFATFLLFVTKCVTCRISTLYKYSFPDAIYLFSHTESGIDFVIH